MQLLRVIGGALVFIAAAMFAPGARAQNACSDCQLLSPTDGFAGWENLDPTGYNPPTIVSCIAVASDNQKCRECTPAYDAFGNPKGYSDCGYVAHDASCDCANAGTASCAGKGSCTYFNL